MIVSFGEIESTALLAARGAGWSWGIAEDAGKSARWLARYGINWLPSFLAMLREKQTAADFDVDGQVVRARTTSDLMPLLVGAYISDGGLKLPILINNVRFPVWLLPFAALSSRQTRESVEMQWSEANVVLLPNGEPVFEAVRTRSFSDDRTDVRLTSKHIVNRRQPNEVSRGVQIDEGDWAKLEQFAHQTYVPASESSRKRGAGAGLADSD